MLEIIRNGSLLIPKDNLELCEKIKNHLTRTLKKYNNSTIDTLYFYIEDDQFLYIPRYYPLDKYINIQINDIINDGCDINIKSNIEFKDKLQKDTFNYMISNDNGIINLDTGSGKTVISIKVISELKKKTLIITHRSNLVQQWITQIEKFTNLKFLENISILKNNNINKSFNNSIVIATIQSLLSAFENRREELIYELINAKFGLVLSDEAHSIVGPKKFSDISLIIPSKKIFGLSATPYRHDGTSDILGYHFGQIYKPNEKSKIVMDAKVTVILVDFGLLPKSQKYIYWGDNFQRARYLNLLKNSNILKGICLGLLNKFKSDRSVFLISERIKFINQLYKLFNYDNKNKFIEKDTNDNLNNQIIFATPGKLKEGIDVPEKDTLILTSPIGNIQQACGRILRSDIDKKTPIVIDIVDIGCHDISTTLNYRLKFYRSRNWEINYLYIHDEIKEIISEYEAKKLI